MSQPQVIGLVLVILVSWRVLHRLNAGRHRKSGWPLGIFKRRHKDPMDAPLFKYHDGTPFTERHAVQSIFVMGAIGSGKSTGPMAHYGRVLLGMGGGGCIFGSKPEDAEFWTKLAAEAGAEMVLFGPKHKTRTNVINELGGDSRNLTEFLMTTSETLRRGKSGGGDEGAFWETMKELTIHEAVEMLRLAYGKVVSTDIKRYIIDAAISAEQLEDEVWIENFHATTNRLACRNATDPIERSNCQQAMTYWLYEWPVMSDKLRSSIQAEVSGVLHVFNSGYVRQLLSTETTFKLEDLEKKWLLIDMPIREHGESAKFVMAALKYAIQRYILARKAKPIDRPICLISDEYQNIMNSPDAMFLAECRSHKGVMLCATQSIHSYYSCMAGERGKHFVDALLTNAGTRVYCKLGDSQSAEHAASSLEKYRETFISISQSGERPSAYDEIMGHSNYNASFSEQYQWRLQPSVFMDGSFRTGGPENKFRVDSVVIRPENFLSGNRFLFTSFPQQLS